MMKRYLSLLLQGFATAAAMLLGNLIGAEWAPIQGILSPVAPAAGVALAALFLVGLPLLPWIVVASVLSRLLITPWLSFSTIVILTTVYTLGYVAGALYLRFHATNRALSTLSDVRRFIEAGLILGAISTLAPLILWSVGLFGQHGSDWHTLLKITLGVLLGRFAGVVIVAAPILTFRATGSTIQSELPSGKRFVCIVATIITTALVFSPLGTGEPITWVLFPSMVLTALWGGSAFTSRSLAIVAVGALWGTTQGWGPFGGELLRYETLQTFMITLSTTSLVLAAVATERRGKEIVEQRGEDLRFLSDTAVELLSSSDLPTSAQKCMNGLAARCQVDVVLYHSVSTPDPDRLTLVAAHGPAADVLVEAETEIQRLVDAARSARSSAQNRDIPSSQPHLRSLRTFVSQPILDGTTVLGALSVGSRTRSSIDVGERELLNTVAFYLCTADKRLRQEALLKESESRFRELANAVPEIVWMSNPDGTQEFFNQRCAEFTGVPSSVPPSVSLLDLCEPSQRAAFAERWTHCLRSGEPFELEHQIRYHDGGYRWVLTRAVPTRNEDGQIRRWFGTSTDLHDQKMLQEQRDALLESETAARREAELADTRKSEFLAVLSHELRNPLNAIVGWAQLLLSGKVDTIKASRIILQSARLQSQLIEDLLDMSRIVSGKVTLAKSSVDFSAIVSGATDAMQLVAQEKGVILESHLEPDIELASADSVRINQIVSNLLSNAVKFTPAGGRVRIGLLQENGEAVLTVTDTGQGIDASFIPHMFDPFSQADPSTTRRYGGLGLGLAIARQLTELHGGSISASSPGLGKGSTFTVRLPRSSSMEAGTTVAEGAAPRTELGADVTLTGRSILIVEDDPATLELMTQSFSDKGATVIACDRGAAALDTVRAQRPDLIISDIAMPDMDGYELMRRIRSMNDDAPHLPAIAVTAFARAEDRRKALEAGFDEHITKPLDTGDLARIAEDVMIDASAKAAN